jgi:hypothetical protein
MKGGVVGYIVKDADGRPILGQFAEAPIHTEWLAAVSAAQAVGDGAGLIPIVAAPQPTADGPRRPGRPRKETAE